MSKKIRHHDKAVEAVCELELKSNSSRQDKLRISHKTVQRPGSHVLSVAATSKHNFNSS